MKSRPVIRGAAVADADAIARIYNHYVSETTVTFEEQSVPVADMATRVTEILDTGLPYLVAEVDASVRGFAYASRWKGRCGYRFSVEVSVYVDADYGGRRIGSALYSSLFPTLHRAGIHAVIGGIALPNEASVALHEKFGLTRVARFREVGFKFGRWIDVGYWERLFDEAAPPA